MSLIPYFEFKGVKYGVGTIVKVPRSRDLRGFNKNNLTREAKFIGGSCFSFIQYQGSVRLCETDFDGKYNQLIEIIEPVYYQESEPSRPPNIFLRTQSGSWDAYNDVCVGLIWYILIMLIGTIFNARLTIWIFATIGFFLWKSKK